MAAFAFLPGLAFWQTGPRGAGIACSGPATGSGCFLGRPGFPLCWPADAAAGRWPRAVAFSSSWGRARFWRPFTMGRLKSSFLRNLGVADSVPLRGRPRFLLGAGDGDLGPGPPASSAMKTCTKLLTRSETHTGCLATLIGTG